MSKLLIAVKSCRRDYRLGAHEVIRGTWGQQFRGHADVRFFVGKSEDSRDHLNLKSDEVSLGCDDSFMGLPWKVKDICQWAVGKVYTHIFLCDNDTYVKPLELMTSGIFRYDYQGFFKVPLEDGPFPYRDVDPNGVNHVYEHCYPWASGGRGYSLSRLAFCEVAEKFPNQNEWAEDLWVGQIIGRAAEKNILKPAIHGVSKDLYSMHYPVERGYDPKGPWMYEMHNKYGKF